MIATIFQQFAATLAGAFHSYGQTSLRWLSPRGYGATAARLTPDQKAGSSNLSALKVFQQIEN